MAEKILAVDDDPNILSAMQRNLRRRFEIDVALGPEEGIKHLSEQGPYAVVITDLRMPEMDGIQFLARAKEIAPDTIRMMLTGHGDMEVAIDAVNEGSIFRFLTKPCPPFRLVQAFSAGLVQYRLVRAERELLEKTLSGSIKVLSDVLALVNPSAFGRSSRVLRLVRQMSEKMQASANWEIELAAMLSQIGCVTVPEETLANVYAGKQISPREKTMFDAHPGVGRDLIANIPRLEGVAEAIGYQELRFDGSDGQAGAPTGGEIPLGARILKLALDFDTLVSSGLDEREALGRIAAKGKNWYDPSVIFALKEAINVRDRLETAELPIAKLSPGMIFIEDVRGSSGILLIAKGQEVTPSLIARLRNYAVLAGVQEPIMVMLQTEAGNGV
jgi:response regulator RpfG family c-di-GMP phosphodiesterase